MSAETNRRLTEFMTLFQDTWAECEAFRTKQRSEALGNRANWEDCLKAAQTHAQELFEPLFSALRTNAPLIPSLDSVRERLEASRK
jgi:hypothetical protein